MTQGRSCHVCSIVAMRGICGSVVLLALQGACRPRGEPLYPVTGRVVFSDGTPVTSGMVIFDSVAADRPIGARGPIGADGRVQMGTRRPGDGVPAGHYRVAIALPAPDGDTGAAGITRPPIDPRFTTPDTSGFECSVGPDQPNVFDLTIPLATARSLPARSTP